MTSRKQRGDYDGKIAGLYDLEDTIGRGHFAVVKLARHVFTGEKVAVKVIDKTKLDEVSRAHLFQEVRCMKLVQHPHVVRLYEVIDTQTKLYLILELGDGGDMYDYIMKHKAGLQESAARLYFRQIVEAISYCHKLHVVHRDLKPENVVFFEKLGIVKLTDFGFSNMFNPGKQLETSCGSLAYSAPEILLGDSYDAPAVDVWSLGVILFMLVCGTPPFQEANDSETLTMIMDCKYKVPSTVSPHCQHLISRMLVREPSQRANLAEILSNPWLVYGLECGVDYLPSSMPLISREHVSDEDHEYVIQKMVEGKIALKEEILESLDKDGYDHIAATYYLLIERRLKKHEQFQHQHAAAMTHLRKKSDASHGTGKPHLEPLSLSPRAKKKGLTTTVVTPSFPYSAYSDDSPINKGVMVQSTKDKKDSSKTGYVQSLLSPPGVHPSAVGARKKSVPDTIKQNRIRKCSLITEESSEISICQEEFMEVEVEPRPVKSMENLLDIIDEPTSSSPALKVTSPSHDPPKRTLKSVCSSPQLLNQIFEENESDDEDDIVPSKFPSNAMFVKHSGVASPEILRKYEQRTKRRGAGQRGTSCSSSDASDNDEAEGRSRKDKLKHKFAHRRDSSDHSSDTDGPSGHGGNYGSGARFNGGGSSSGGGGSGPPDSQDKDDRNSNRKDNSGGKSKGHRQNHIGHNLDINMKVLTNRLSQISAKSVTSHNGNCSRSPQNLNSHNTVSQSSFTSIASHYIGHGKSDTESMMEVQSRDFSDIGQEYEPVEKRSLCTNDCQLMNGSVKSTNKLLTDINSNGIQPTYCKPDVSQCIVVPSVESKCCSVV